MPDQEEISPEVSVGVLLDRSPDGANADETYVDESGHVPASRWHGRHEAAIGNRI